MNIDVKPAPAADPNAGEQRFDSREDYLAHLENKRREAIAARKLYRSGSQYDADNDAMMKVCRDNPGELGEKGVARWLGDRYHLPEHLRKHAYCTQLHECVSFVADRLAEGFTVEAASSGKPRSRREDEHVREGRRDRAPGDPAPRPDELDDADDPDRAPQRDQDGPPRRDPSRSSGRRGRDEERDEVREAKDPVQVMLDDCLAASPELSGGDDEDDQLTLATVLREAAWCGDVPVLVRWDNVEAHAWLEFWDSEQVDMRFVDDHPDRLERVLVDQMDWRPVPDGANYPDPEQCVIRREWVLTEGPEPAVGEADPGGNRVGPADDGEATERPLRRCVERVYIWDKDEKLRERPVEVIEWGCPVLPWWPIRADHATLRSTRGASLVTDQAMRSVDRYDANENLSFTIGRANSHSTVVLTGEVVPQQVGSDGVMRGTVVRKDVLDAMIFPGTVNVEALSLPTDTAVYDRQHKVLLEAICGTFGLTRTDAEAVSEIGEVSGYALEILNQQAAGMFSRVRARFVRDLKALFNVVVDCHVAWVSGATTPPDPADDDPLTADPNADLITDEGDRPATASRGDTDPYPDRTIIVTLGTGWIVDESKLRDDLTANAISREGMWRERGKSPDWVRRNEEELAEQRTQGIEEAQQRFEATGGEMGRFGIPGAAAGGAGARDDDPRAEGGRPVPGRSSTAQAGRTVGDARAPGGRDRASRRGTRGRAER